MVNYINMLLYLRSSFWEKLFYKLSLNSRKNLLICDIFTMDFFWKVGKSTILYTTNSFSNMNTINNKAPMNKINNFLTNRNNNEQKNPNQELNFLQNKPLTQNHYKPTIKNIAQISSSTYVKMININYVSLIVYDHPSYCH